MKTMIEIDGSKYEGGGAILRVTCALSTVTNKPCRVFNIRKNRPKPGLATQHLLGIQALAQLCNGHLEGDKLGSQEIWFHPGEIKSKDLHIKIDTAGSITLVLQTLILPALLASSPTKIVFDGGATDTFFSPTIDYFRYVFLEILEKMGAKIEININKRGYYPEGGAKIETKIYPSKIKALSLTKRGQLKKILAVSGASETLKDKKVAERQLAGVREILGKLKLPIEERIEYYQTQCPGSQICLIAEFSAQDGENTFIGTDNLGKLGKRAEDVGRECALELIKEQKSDACPHTNGAQAEAKFGVKGASTPSGVGACLDKHLADQILPYLALTSGKSEVTISEITNHCKTNIWVIEKFIKGKYRIEHNLITWTPPTHHPLY